MTQLEIAYRRLDTLLPYARNSRTHSEEQVGQIAASIKEFGFTNPILVSEGGDIIAGHGRAKAAARLGLEEVPTIELRGLTKSQRQAYVIADNRLAMNAGWDSSMLSVELLDLKSMDFDLDLLGFDEKELASLLDPEVAPSEGLTDDDDLPEQVDTRCKPGDLWVLGSHRLLCGDSKNVLHVERLMGGEKADMVFTDPPYGLRLEERNMGWERAGGGVERPGAKNQKFSGIIGDNEDFSAALVLSFFKEVKEVFLWGANYYFATIEDIQRGAWMVWDKRIEESLDRAIGSCFELCWSKQRHKQQIARIRWSGCYGTEKEDIRKRIHPAQKPTLLAEWFFERWGKPEDCVVDLFLGSGSTLIACEKTARRCFGMEIDPKYCDVILTRWEKFTGKEAKLDG